jgi:hypothetical protein
MLAQDTWKTEGLDYKRFGPNNRSACALPAGETALATRLARFDVLLRPLQVLGGLEHRLFDLVFGGMHVVCRPATRGHGLGIEEGAIDAFGRARNTR